MVDVWIQRHHASDSTDSDKEVTRCTMVLATDASNQDGKDRGILAGKPAPLDVADKMLLTVADLRVDYNSKVITALRVGAIQANLVWVFQPPTSVF